MDKAFPDMAPMKGGVAATTLLATPVIRHVVNWLGARKASKPNFFRGSTRTVR